MTNEILAVIVIYFCVLIFGHGYWRMRTRNGMAGLHLYVVYLDTIKTILIIQKQFLFSKFRIVKSA